MNLKSIKKTSDTNQNYLKIKNKINRFAMPKKGHPKFGKCKVAFN